MPSSITCSTKTLTLEIAPFLFILVGVLCEFTMVPGVYILLSPPKKEVHYILPEGTDVRIQEDIHQKDISYLTSYDYAKVN